MLPSGLFSTKTACCFVPYPTDTAEGLTESVRLQSHATAPYLVHSMNKIAALVAMTVIVTFSNHTCLATYWAWRHNKERWRVLHRFNLQVRGFEFGVRTGGFSTQGWWPASRLHKEAACAISSSTSRNTAHGTEHKQKMHP